MEVFIVLKKGKDSQGVRSSFYFSFFDKKKVLIIILRGSLSHLKLVNRSKLMNMSER